MATRRQMLFSGAAALGGAALLSGRSTQAAQVDADGSAWDKSYAGDRNQPALEPGQPGKDYTPVITPNGAALPSMSGAWGPSSPRRQLSIA